MKMLKTTLVIALAAGSASATFAADDLSSNNMLDVVSFRTSVNKEVKHNYWQATIFTQTQNDSLAKANTQVNQTLQKALATLKNEKDVQVKDNDIYSRVHYNDKDKQDGWIVNGNLTLRSTSSEALSKALTDLKGTMAVQGMQSGVSKAKLAKLDNELIQKALAQFKKKAEFITESMGAKGYKIVSININSPMSDSYNPPYMFAANLRSSNSDTPVMGNQTTDIKASIDAQIQLILK